MYVLYMYVYNTYIEFNSIWEIWKESYSLNLNKWVFIISLEQLTFKMNFFHN